MTDRIGGRHANFVGRLIPYDDDSIDDDSRVWIEHVSTDGATSALSLQTSPDGDEHANRYGKHTTPTFERLAHHDLHLKVIADVKSCGLSVAAVYRRCEIHVTIEVEDRTGRLFWIVNSFFKAGKRKGPGNAPGPFMFVFVPFVF